MYYSTFKNFDEELLYVSCNTGLDRFNFHIQTGFKAYSVADFLKSSDAIIEEISSESEHFYAYFSSKFRVDCIIYNLSKSNFNYFFDDPNIHVFNYHDVDYIVFYYDYEPGIDD